ncbi:hypothetical protein H4R20_005582 [Coemansia guatemalensis]|uniref:Uncharacterized protein n=1 Tax=Coemansia guatemalensis TaxID=2761395 RepID=A0A9W8HSH0_9FUNG|nr:hypothetical protein H4R20_005582 [Coemansia guatemalensis]
MDLDSITDIEGNLSQNATYKAKEAAEIEANANMRCAREPLSWKELKEIVAAEDPSKMGKRCYEVQLEYEKLKLMVKKEYGTMFEYLKTHVLTDFVAQTKEPEFDPSTPLTASNLLLVKADFPYYFEEGVEHWIIWCTKYLPVGNVCPDAAAKVIKQAFGNDAEWTYLVNIVENQSVQELSHGHIFVKRSPDAVPAATKNDSKQQ